MLATLLLDAALAAPTAAAGPDPLAQLACVARLAELGGQAEPARLAPPEDARCRVQTPVQLLALRDDRLALALPEAPVLDCRFALALVRWLQEVAVPVAAWRFGAAPSALLTGPGYSCRPRNHQADAPLSEHAFGNALDLMGWRFADGREVALTAPEPPAPAALRALRGSACGYFTTVLGPGADAFHDDHLHVDLGRHGRAGRGRLCR
jgi:hypothetical protein